MPGAVCFFVLALFASGGSAVGNPIQACDGVDISDECVVTDTDMIQMRSVGRSSRNQGRGSTSACGSEVEEHVSGASVAIQGTVTISSGDECALEFESSGGFLVVSGASYRGPTDGAFTIVAKIKRDALTTYDIIFEAKGIRFGFLNDNLYMWRTGYKVFDSVSVPLGSFHVVALSFDGGQTFSAFLDGTLVGTYDHPPGTHEWSPGKFTIGAGHDGSTPVHQFEGKMAYVKQYDYDMLAGETMALDSVDASTLLFDINSGGSSSTTAASVTAFGDPHLKNIKKESFVVRRAGHHTLLNVPQGTAAVDALLHIGASMERMNSGCSSLFIRSLAIMGQWLGPVPPLRFAAGGALPGEADGAVLQAGNSSALTIEEFLSMVPADMIKLSLASKGAATPSVTNKHATLMTAALKLGPGVAMKVSWTSERTPSASIAHSLWVTVTGLAAAGEAIGGLLGQDDHHYANTPEEKCMESGGGSLLSLIDGAAIAEASLQ